MLRYSAENPMGTVGVLPRKETNTTEDGEFAEL